MVLSFALIYVKNNDIIINQIYLYLKKLAVLKV